MKRNLVLGAALALAFAVGTVAGDKVNVEHRGNKERVDVGDLKMMSVCALKAKVAGMYDLKMNKFDLVKSGVKLNDDKTLYAAYVRNHNKLQVREVNYSSQC